MISAEPNQNVILAAIWFVIALAVASSAVIVLFVKAPLLSPALLMMSALLFMLSAQRTQRYAIETTKFKKRMQFVAFATAILSSLSIVFNAAVQ